MNMKKRLFSISIITVATSLLTGCLGSSAPATSEPASSGATHKYSTELIGIEIPNEWDVLLPKDFTSNVPANIIIALRNNIKNEKFIADVVILKNELPTTTSSEDYAKLLYQRLSTDLIGFKEVGRESIMINVAGKATPTLLLIVEGQETAAGEPKRFIETVGIKDKTAFLAIGASLTSDDAAVAKKIESMIRSFEVK